LNFCAMKTTLALLGSTFLLAASTLAGPLEPGITPISARELLRDFEALKNAPTFSLDPRLGNAPLAVSFRRLLEYPAAAAQCRKLVAEGTKCGQLYGLLGLKLLNDPAYALVARRYQASRAYADVIDETHHYPGQLGIEQIAEMIESGNIK
jgi:hypothetical protein